MWADNPFYGLKNNSRSYVLSAGAHIPGVPVEPVHGALGGRVWVAPKLHLEGQRGPAAPGRVEQGAGHEKVRQLARFCHLQLRLQGWTLHIIGSILVRSGCAPARPSGTHSHADLALSKAWSPCPQCARNWNTALI